MGYDSTVLVTGYPALEARLLAERILGREAGTLLFCLVQQPDAAAASEAAAALPARDRDRLVLVQGDPAGMDLGLSGREFLDIRERVDRIYHLASILSPSASAEQTQRGNVEAVSEIVGLAREANHLRCLVIRSSASVAGDRSGVVREDELMEGQHFRNTVERTLAHGERIALRAMNKHVPIAVVRPSMVVGHSDTGQVEHYDGPYTLVLLMLGSPNELAPPLPARGSQPLNLVPIDYVVSATHHIGCDARAAGRTFHIVDPTPLPARRVVELIAQAAGRRTPRGHIPSYLARAVLRAPGIERLLKRPAALTEYMMTSVRYDARNAEEILAGSGITCPPFESYVDRLVAWVRDHARQSRIEPPPAALQDDDPLL